MTHAIKVTVKGTEFRVSLSQEALRSVEYCGADVEQDLAYAIAWGRDRLLSQLLDGAEGDQVAGLTEYADSICAAIDA